MSQRTYPTDYVAEKACLGACFNSDSGMEAVIDTIGQEHFSDPRHKFTLKVLDKFYKSGDRLDFDALLTHLEETNTLEKAGGFEYLDGIRITYRSVEVRTYIADLEQVYASRNLIDLGLALLEENKLSLEERIVQANDMLSSVGAKKGESKALEHYIKDRRDGLSALEFYTQRKKEFDSGIRTLLGIPIGWPILDDALEGLIKKELVLVGGRPSMGKSEICIQMVVSMLRKGFKIMLFSLEMTPEQITDRITAIATEIRAARLRKGDFSERELERIRAEWPKIEEMAKNLVINDSPSLSVIDMQARVRRQMVTEGVDVVFVDHLAKIRPAGSGSLYQTTSETVRSIKNMAISLDIPVVLAAQLNRSNAKGALQGLRPTMADFRDSGAVEEEADKAILIHRPDYYDPNEKPGLVEFIVDKNRESFRGPIKMMFDWKTQQLSEYVDVEEVIHGIKQPEPEEFFTR